MGKPSERTRRALLLTGYGLMATAWILLRYLKVIDITPYPTWKVVIYGMAAAGLIAVGVIHLLEILAEEKQGNHWR